MPSKNQIMQAVQQLKSNPSAILGPRFNIPQNLNDPNTIIQHLLNTGQIKQEQVNQLMSLRNSPLFKGMF
jgi:hypothetical protein